MLDPVRAAQLAGHLDGCTACDELVAWSTRAAGSCLRDKRRKHFEAAETALRAALAIVERALRLRPDETPGRLAPLRFTLARARWDAGRDRPRAIALARQAAEAQLRPGESVIQADISAWLAAHAPR